VNEKLIETDEIPEKGITVTTVVVDGVTETAVQQSAVILGAEGETEKAGIALIQNPHAAGDHRLQHDLAIRDVYAGEFGDFSEQADQSIAP
jgi:hypothetical protein